MNIFKKEKLDGVSELVQSSNSIAYCSPAILCDKNETSQELACDKTSSLVSKIKAQAANPEQVDLYYLKSVLVSTGWNKNDDVFDPSETWIARNTPEDKQFNFMHNENDIIGHITGSYVVDRDGNKLSEETQPDSFDIITEAVLYNSWTNPENRNRMKQIIAEIEEGKWFVSMECLFSGFDYAISGEDGSSEILERSEASSFLTKHLRAYGGSGEYEGRKIGRSLKGISFSGKGLVSKPANPRSVILDASRASSRSFITLETSLGGHDMSDTSVLEQQLAEVRSELASANEALESERAVMKKKKEEEEAVMKKKMEKQEAEIKSLEESVASKDATITELQESLAKSEEDMKEKMEQLRKMQKEKNRMTRKASLVDLGFSDEEAEESLASYEELDDSSFDLVLAAMKKVAVKKEEAMKMKKEEEEKAKMKPKAEEEAEAEEATEELFEGVESAEAALVEASDDETDELEATRASVAEWLENNVLRTK